MYIRWEGIRSHARPCWSAALVVAMGIAACRGVDDSSPTSSRQAAVSTALSAAVAFGFEVPGAWSSPGHPETTLSDNHTEGLHSLAVTPKGYVPFTSVSFSTPQNVTRTIALDLWLPAEQPNKFWLGAVQMFLSIPSQGVFNAYLGQNELTGLPLKHWNSLSFTIESAVFVKLRETYADATFTIALNVPSNASGVYLLDHLRFDSVTTTTTVPCAGGKCTVITNQLPPQASADPAGQGQPFDPKTLPPSDGTLDPGEEHDVRETHFSPEQTFSLAPGAVRSISATATEASLIVARARWTGAGASIAVRILRPGNVTAGGAPLSIPPDRGITTARVQSTGATSFTVEARNAGSTSAQVRLLAGFLPLSAI
jgi:hypothetical protein